MAVIFWGTHVFNSFKGYYGDKITCPNCNKTYAPSYVKSSRWFHLEFIPLFPCGSSYYKTCPICGCGDKLKGKEGREDIKTKAQVTDQRLEPYVNHVLANKPKGFLKTDTSYEFHVKDLNTGEDFCVKRGIDKSEVNNIKKARAYKSLPIINV